MIMDDGALRVTILFSKHKFHSRIINIYIYSWSHKRRIFHDDVEANHCISTDACDRYDVIHKHFRVLERSTSRAERDVDE